MSNTSALITLGIVGVGGYFFIKDVWPSLKIELEKLGKGAKGGGKKGGKGGGRNRSRGSPSPLPPPNYGYNDYGSPSMMPPSYPIYDDYRYPPTTNYIIEDRYPDYYPYYNPYPYPYYNPPIYYPPSHRNCDGNEFWNGNRCERRDRPDHDRPDRPRPRPDRDGDGRPNWPHRPDRPDHPGGPRPDRPPRPNPPNNNGNTRDRWHADRDREDRIKAGVVTAGTRPSTTPRVETAPVRAREKDRVKEIVKKASEAFFEVDY